MYNFEYIKANPGFYQFRDHPHCYMLSTRSRKVHYGSVSQGGISHPDNGEMHAAYFFKPAAVPPGFRFPGVPAEDLPSARGPLLLLLTKKPWN